MIQPQHKRTVLNKKKAVKLYKENKENITVPGSGFLIKYKNNDYENHIDYISTVILTFDQLLQGNVESKMHPAVYIGLEIYFKQIRTEGQLIELFNNKILPLLNDDFVKEKLKVINLIIQNGEEDSWKQLEHIIKFLQTKQLSILISLQTSNMYLSQYQEYITIFCTEVLENEYIFLHTISLCISLPKMNSDQKEDDYLRSLIAIWRRTIPINISSIVVKDWLYLKISKPLFRLHFIQHLPIIWCLQFATCSPQHAQQLGLQCLGLQ